jgi:hypothetical protein
VVTAPEPLRTRLRRLALLQPVASAAAFRPASPLATPTAATKPALEVLYESVVWPSI